MVMREGIEMKSDVIVAFVFARYAPARLIQRAPVRTALTEALFGEKYGLPSFIMHQGWCLFDD